MLKSLLSCWFLQSPEVALQLEITSAGSQCLALTCWHSHVVLLNCEGDSAVLHNSRNSSTMRPEDEINFSWLFWRDWIFPDSLFFWLDLWNIIARLRVSHISAEGGSIERIVKMTNYAVCFRLLWGGNMHSLASLGCMTQKKHLLERGWNGEVDV